MDLESMSLITEADLVELGMKLAGHRKKALLAIAALPKPAPRFPLTVRVKKGGDDGDDEEEDGEEEEEEEEEEEKRPKKKAKKNDEEDDDGSGSALSFDKGLEDRRGKPGLALSGCRICLTGAMSLTRERMTQLIRHHGGDVTGSVSGKTTHLVAAIQGTGKHQAGESKGVPVVPEAWIHAKIKKFTKNEK